MKAAKVFGGFLAVLVGAPIWYFLLYTILDAIHADRLIWFLFWVYVPLGFLVSVIAKVAEIQESK